MDDLRKLVKKAHDRDEKAMLDIIEIFKPYFKKLVQKSSYCVEESDLILHILHIINILNPEKLSNFELSGQVFNYIKLGIKNKYIQLITQYFNIQKNEIFLKEDIISNISNQVDELYEDIYFKELLNHLTRLQKKVIIEKIIHNKSDIEISNELHISRQSVNRIKNRALKKLKDYI